MLEKLYDEALGSYRIDSPVETGSLTLTCTTEYVPTSKVDLQFTNGLIVE